MVVCATGVDDDSVASAAERMTFRMLFIETDEKNSGRMKTVPTLLAKHDRFVWEAACYFYLIRSQSSFLVVTK